MASSISNAAIQNNSSQKAVNLSNEGSPSNLPHDSAMPRLHPKESIGLAAFLGSPIAGGVLLAHNLVNTKRTAQAVMVMLGTIAVTGIMIAIGIAIPEGVRLGVIIPLAAAMGLKKIAENLLSAEYQMVEAGKSKAYSNWIGAGFGLIVAGILFAMIWLSL